jgi:hypothetical protein
MDLPLHVIKIKHTGIVLSQYNDYKLRIINCVVCVSKPVCSRKFEFKCVSTHLAITDLTPWSRDLQNLRIVQLVNKSPTFYGTRISLQRSQETKTPNVVVEWLTLMLRIKEVPASNPGPETGYPD